MVKFSDLLARTCVTSFGRQFDFYDVICHLQPCSIDIRWRNVDLTTNVCSNGM